MSGTGGGISGGGGTPPPAVHGFEVLAAALELQATASGAWTDSTLEVALPAAGTYQLDALVRAAVTGTGPVNVFISARLFDVTAGAVVPDSEVIVVQQNFTSGGSGDNDSAPILVEYTVTGPTVVRLQGQRTNAQGTSNAARIVGNVSGQVTLRYLRVAP